MCYPSDCLGSLSLSLQPHTVIPLQAQVQVAQARRKQTSRRKRKRFSLPGSGTVRAHVLGENSVGLRAYGSRVPFSNNPYGRLLLIILICTSGSYEQEQGYYGEHHFSKSVYTSFVSIVKNGAGNGCGT